jgi:hypothetical protein
MRIDRSWISGAALAAALAASFAAVACGVCIEDRVAAVYEQGGIDRAIGHGQQVAFYSIDGALPATDAARKAVAAAVEREGVHGSARVSTESATVSVAFDPKRTSLARVQERATHDLASHGLTLAALRVIGKDGVLREPGAAPR